jgi:hypothetical protein
MYPLPLGYTTVPWPNIQAKQNKEVYTSRAMPFRYTFHKHSLLIKSKSGPCHTTVKDQRNKSLISLLPTLLFSPWKPTQTSHTSPHLIRHPSTPPNPSLPSLTIKLLLYPNLPAQPSEPQHYPPRSRTDFHQAPRHASPQRPSNPNLEALRLSHLNRRHCSVNLASISLSHNQYLALFTFHRTPLPSVAQRPRPRIENLKDARRKVRQQQ